MLVWYLWLRVSIWLVFIGVTWPGHNETANQNQYELEYCRKIRLMEVAHLFDFRASWFRLLIKLFPLRQCFLSHDPQNIIFLHCYYGFNYDSLSPAGLLRAFDSTNIACDAFKVRYSIWCCPSLFHFTSCASHHYFFSLMEYLPGKINLENDTLALLYVVFHLPS